MFMSSPPRRAAALLLFVASPLALAQGMTSDDELYLGQGIMRGSPRVFGLAGAYSGIAEGADGFMHNPAAVANRLLPFEHDLNFDVSGVFHLLPPNALGKQDWDNDGRADSALTNSGVLGTILGGVMIAGQYQRFGLGLGFEATGYHYELDRGDGTKSDVAVAFSHFYLAAAVSLLSDDIVVGGGVEASNAAFAEFRTPATAAKSCPVRIDVFGFQREADDCYSYSGFGPYLGVLFRPNRSNWRLGASLKPATVAGPDLAVYGGASPQSRKFAGDLLSLPNRVLVPARLSIGFSFRLASEGDVPYNLFTGDFGKIGDEIKGSELPPPLPSRKLLISSEVTVLLPVAKAVSMESFFHQADRTSPEYIGEEVMFIPRVALEGDPINERLRLRLGLYLEPSPFKGGPWRPHVTFGAELAMFKLWQRWSIGASVDVGDQLGGAVPNGAAEPPGHPSYFNLSIAILVWK